MRRTFLFAVILILLSSALVQAGSGYKHDFYKHDHPSYWWYVVEKPGFSAVVPSTAQSYIERSIFGMEKLEMAFEGGAVTMEVIHQPGDDIEAVKKSLQERYKPLVKDVTLISDREITTTNQLKAHFYAYEATGAHGKKVIFRSVLFKREGSIVYLTLLLDSDDYHGDMREYWIRAVNEFEWD
ncbi:MAG TPA: hypothetical protein GX528_04870 [Firmicutes bacterium]|nr:hypothetical protein [Bacillota bacterium]